MEDVEKVTIRLALVEENFLTESDELEARSERDDIRMDASLWGQMPEELVETILLFLPKRSQARFRSVCKPWKQLMTSPAFREQTSSIAFKFQRGHPLCIAQLCRGDRHAVPDTVQERCKVRKLDIPGGLTLPAALATSDLQLFGHAGVPVLGVASVVARLDGYVDVRCWLLNTADSELAWRELPRRTLNAGHHSIAVRLVPGPPGTGRFQVVVTSQGIVMTYALGWQQEEWRTTRPTWAHLGNYKTEMELEQLVSGTMLPDVRLGKFMNNFELLVDCRGGGDSNNDISDNNVFAYGPTGRRGTTTLGLYKWDGGSGEWKQVVSGPPDGWKKGCSERMFFFNVKAQISGNMVLISAHVSGNAADKSYYPDILAYHIPSGSSKWLRPQTGDVFVPYDHSVANLISIASVKPLRQIE